MFGAFMKMAGWDGVAVIGRAESPVYINVLDDKVTIEDATDLWGAYYMGMPGRDLEKIRSKL